MAAKEKMVSRINRIENENRELKAKLEKYETGELQSDVPDSVVWGMYLSERKTRKMFFERWRSLGKVNKELRDEVADFQAQRQRSIELLNEATDKLEELQQELEESKEENESLEEYSNKMRTERDAALDMLESEFCKSEMLGAMIETNHKLETKLAEHEI